MINELTVVKQLRDVLYAGLNPVTEQITQDEVVEDLEELDVDPSESTIASDPEPDPEPAAPEIPVILDFPM